MDFVIAVDGTAASGKGTLATALARIYGLPHLDTGLLYRAVGLAVRRAGGDLGDASAAAAAAAGLDLKRLDEPALRSAEAGEAASQVAAHAEVRRVLAAFQRAFADQPGGAVLDGRDIGTVIAPEAAAKLFVDARPDVRARRRLRQLGGLERPEAIGEMARALLARDERDAARPTAPLRRAADAVLLDTSEMDISEAADAARRIVEVARARWLELQSQG